MMYPVLLFPPGTITFLIFHLSMLDGSDGEDASLLAENDSQLLRNGMSDSEVSMPKITSTPLKHNPSIDILRRHASTVEEGEFVGGYSTLFLETLQSNYY